MAMKALRQSLRLSVYLVLLVMNTAMAQLNPSSATNEALRQALSASSLTNKVVYPQSNGSYADGLNAYFSNQERALIPSCIVQAENSEDVSTFVSIVASLRQKGNDVKFAVRSGGHTPFAGSANINDPGATLDLRKLNQTHVHPSRKRVTLGTGATWGDVYSQLDPQSLAVSGGRVAAIGVGGLTLGGK